MEGTRWAVPPRASYLLGVTASPGRARRRSVQQTGRDVLDVQILAPAPSARLAVGVPLPLHSESAEPLTCYCRQQALDHPGRGTLEAS